MSGFPPLEYVFSRPRATIIIRRLFPLFGWVWLSTCAPAETSPDRVEGAGRAAAAGEAAEAIASRPRVVFLGTSLTAGLGLSRDDDTYVSRVAELADSAGRPIEAVNAGVSGETSAGGLRRLDWILRQPLDVLVVELGANDGLRGQSPEALAGNLTAIVERTRTRYPRARVLLLAMEAPPNLGPAYVSAFRSVYPAVAERTGAALGPFPLEGVAGIPELNQSDGIHPTPEGHRIMASNVWPALDALLSAPDAGGNPER